MSVPLCVPHLSFLSWPPSHQAAAGECAVGGESLSVLVRELSHSLWCLSSSILSHGDSCLNVLPFGPGLGGSPCWFDGGLPVLTWVVPLQHQQNPLEEKPVEGSLSHTATDPGIFFLWKFRKTPKQSNDYFNYASPFGLSAHALCSSVLHPRFGDAAFLCKKTSDLVGWPMCLDIENGINCFSRFACPLLVLALLVFVHVTFCCLLPAWLTLK